MLMKTFAKFSLLFFLPIIMVSCEKNYARELTSLSHKLNSEGKQILYQTKNVTQQDHKIIYIDGDNIMLNNIDSVTTILSGNSIIRIHDLAANFLYDGELTITDDIKEETLSKYIEKEKYDEYEIQYQCINGDYLIIKWSGRIDSYEDLICIKRPSELYRHVGITNEFDDAGNIIMNINGSLTTYPYIEYDFPLLPDPMMFYKGICAFTWAVTVNKQGEIISKAKDIISYGIKIPVEDLTKMDDNDKNMLSSRYLPLIERQIYFE